MTTVDHPRSTWLRLRRLLDQLADEDASTFLETQDADDLTVDALAAALESREDDMAQHARRVTDIALALARAVDPELAGEPALRHGFLLHDIGKLGIPDAIVRKPGPLTVEERRIMQTHTTLGEHVLALVPFVSPLVHDVVAHHHERWDGSGYPRGLSGEAIPLAARIFAVADAFDAITSDRPYRPAQPVAAAIDEIERCAGTQFDPCVVPVFVVVARRLDVGAPL